MAFDLDDEELKATRRMNGSDKDVGSMEQDIKILENYLDKNDNKLVSIKRLEFLEAIEHLIKAYKELEEDNSLLIQQNITYKRNIHDLKNKNIPVSLVEEKIEEYTKLLKNCNRFSDIDRIKAINERILELQELLEGGKEKTADELFDDLGLWLERETPFDFEVKNDDDKVIKFNKERREIACFNYYDGFEYLTLQELQAINKKCQELGWLKED